MHLKEGCLLFFVTYLYPGMRENFWRQLHRRTLYPFHWPILQTDGPILQGTRQHRSSLTEFFLPSFPVCESREADSQVSINLWHYYIFPLIVSSITRCQVFL